MEQRVRCRVNWKARTGGLAGAAVVTTIFVAGSSSPTAAIVPLATHVEASASNEDSYWVVTSAGKVYAFGDARFYGDMSGKRLNAPIVGHRVQRDHKWPKTND
jgi:hypothetical protein